jgi:preprotein translocase subunit YajC
MAGTAVYRRQGMFENLILIAVVIMIMWVGVLAYYLITSRQQADLQKDIESLREMLDEGDTQSS